MKNGEVIDFKTAQFNKIFNSLVAKGKKGFYTEAEEKKALQDFSVFLGEPHLTMTELEESFREAVKVLGRKFPEKSGIDF